MRGASLNKSRVDWKVSQAQANLLKLSPHPCGVTASYCHCKVQPEPYETGRLLNFLAGTVSCFLLLALHSFISTILLATMIPMMTVKSRGPSCGHSNAQWGTLRSVRKLRDVGLRRSTVKSS